MSSIVQNIDNNIIYKFKQAIIILKACFEDFINFLTKSGMVNRLCQIRVYPSKSDAPP